MDKRGQAAAAVLLAIIAFFLIVFIILIPPAERAELLGEQQGSPSVSGSSGIIKEKTLLTVSPGRIDYLAQKEIEHPLPVVNIFTRTEAKVLAQKNLALATRGIFTEETSDFAFSVADPANTENVLLTFNLVEISGRLKITFNGEKIYDDEASVGSLKPILLSKTLLKEDNLITFSVSSPGIAFWKTNGIRLEEIKVIADVTSVEAQSSKNIFLVSETEKANLEKVVLKFQPDCNFGQSGKLRVTINGNEIYNSLPDCEIALVPIELSPSLVHEGENEIIFSSDKGEYLLSHVLIASRLKEVDFPTYYFDLSLDDFNKVLDGSLRVRLNLDFVDVIVQKTGDLIFNGHTLPFDTKEGSFVADLSDYTVKGTNALKIKPSKTIEIRQLEVDLVK